MCPVVSGSRRELFLFKRCCFLAYNFVKLFRGSPCPSFQASAPFSTIYSGCAWARSKKCNVLMRSRCFPPLWVTNRRTYLNTDSLCCVCFVRVSACVQANPPFDQSSSGAAFVVAYPMSGWVCRWKPFWIPVGDSFKKSLTWKSGSSSAVNFLTDRTLWISLLECIPVTLKISKQFYSLPWESAQDEAFFSGSN